MKRLNVVAVVVVALLVVTAVPANVQAASANLVVGSQHDADSDFKTAQVLDNLEIIGSGSSATITFPDHSTEKNNGEQSSVGESSSDYFVQSFKANHDNITELGFWLKESQSDGDVKIAIAPDDGSGHADVNNTIYSSTLINPGTTGQWFNISTGGVSVTKGETYYLIVDGYNNSGATGSAAVGLSTETTDTKDNAEFSNDAGASWPQLSDPLAIHLEYQTKDSRYVSDTHNVSNAQEAAINITQASNVSVEATVRTDGGTVLNQTTLTSTGNHSLTLADTSSDQLETELNVSVTGDDPQFELADESILFNNTAPTVDNTSASPTGELSQQSITLSINASDETFGTVQGDELTATFYVDGSQVGTDTLTSNGTASVNYEATTGGSHDWYVVVEDDYGASVTSNTFTFKAPSEIEFRKETAPSELVDNVEVQVVAYYSGEIQRRNVTNGKLNLSGFPIDEPIIIRANASGYYSRTAVVESVYDQNNVYLLNDNRSSHLIRFDLQDLTGSFPKSDTVLFVERDIELNNSTEWRVIAGDEFGVQGIPVYLEQDERYRLRIKNLDTGRTAVIGAFSPVQDESVTISTGSASINIPESEKEYGWAIGLNNSAQEINFRYSDDENMTDEVKLTIHERFNKSNVLVDNVTFTSANDITYSRSLTANETNTTWMGELYVDRGDGYMHFRLPLSGGITDIVPGGLDAVWLNGVGVFVVLISSLAFSELNQGVGAIATALIGGVLWWFGVLSDIAIGPAIVVALMVAVIYHYYSNPSPGGGI